MDTPVRLYKKWLLELKSNIQQSRLQTALKVNSDMLILSWYIGKQLSDKIDEEGWGTKVIEQLAEDLQNSFSDMRGFSQRNLLYIKQLADAYPEMLITQQPVAQFGNISHFLSNPLLVSIPWAHHVTLLDKIHDKKSCFGKKKITNYEY